MKCSLLLIAFIWLMVLPVAAQSNGELFRHQPFDSLLQKYVDTQGLVDYQSIKNNPVLLQDYLNQIEQLDPSIFRNWTREQKMAFWINAYNAITIYGIVENYPIQYGNLIARARFPQNSIRQIGGFWDNVFVKVMQQDISLNQIEHEILREEYKDPRIHAVLVCAAIGCPILENQAFYPENLDFRLDKANRDFINNPDKVKVDQQENILHLSSIFDWYKEDYLVSDENDPILEKYDSDIRGVIEFILKYIAPEKNKYIKKNIPKIKYLDYDWTLNEQ